MEVRVGTRSVSVQRSAAKEFILIDVFDVTPCSPLR
jgi:hypothetical protein